MALGLVGSLLLVPLYSIPAQASTTSKFYLKFGNTPNNLRPAINAAAFIWSLNFRTQIPVTINVSVKSGQTIDDLASGTPTKYFINFPGSKLSNIYYPAALANILANKDLTQGEGEINIFLNPSWVNDFYAGTDGKGPANKIDLETLMLHEIAHGLGIISGASDISGFGTFTTPTIFDAFLQKSDGTPLITIPSGLPLGTALTSDLYWNGPLSSAVNSGKPLKLYAPPQFELASSISHFDPSNTNADALKILFPNIAPGFVSHRLSGPINAVMKDLLSAPILGSPKTAPDAPIKAQVITLNNSAEIEFSPPITELVSQILNYQVKVMETGQIFSSKSSPIQVNSLENGKSYTLQLTAINALGQSNPIIFNKVTPNQTWNNFKLYKNIKIANFVTANLNSKTYIFYEDAKTGDLVSATLISGGISNGNWKVVTLDGIDSKIPGSLKHQMTGYISQCANTQNYPGIPKINLFYQDISNSTLRWASWDGKKWNLETLDGNGNQKVFGIIRERTSDNVGTASACVINSSGLQVFYRDENQGLLLGSTLSDGQWKFETVDGNSDKNGRTTYDVGTHLAATVFQNRIYLAYDAISGLYQDGSISGSDIQIASRNNTDPASWGYATFDASTQVPSAGFAIGIWPNQNNVQVSWISTSTQSYPVPDSIRVLNLKSGAITLSGINTPLDKTYSINSFPNFNNGMPSYPMGSTSSNIFYRCSTHLCNLNLKNTQISLVSNIKIRENTALSTINNNNIDYLLALGTNQQLYLFAPPK